MYNEDGGRAFLGGGGELRTPLPRRALLARQVGTTTIGRRRNRIKDSSSSPPLDRYVYRRGEGGGNNNYPSLVAL